MPAAVSLAGWVRITLPEMGVALSSAHYASADYALEPIPIRIPIPSSRIACLLTLCAREVASLPRDPHELGGNPLGGIHPHGVGGWVRGAPGPRAPCVFLFLFSPAPPGRL